MRPSSIFLFLGVSFLLLVSINTLMSPIISAEPVKYDAGDRRDPMVPLIGPGGMPIAKKTGPGDYNIEGIIYDPKSGSMVLINQEFYKEGDRIGDANLISIFKDRIILSQDDKEKAIWIREEIVSPGEQTNDSKASDTKAV